MPMIVFGFPVSSWSQDGSFVTVDTVHLSPG
jgi:hypothetical protein